eukprot:12704858-Prorocentrum_lima.AAC.1
MTSSLVGSEMCIRDRRRSSSHDGEAWEEATLMDKQQESENTLNKQSIIPVSYTHLTLPTICSV